MYLLFISYTSATYYISHISSFLIWWSQVDFIDAEFTAFHSYLNPASHLLRINSDKIQFRLSRLLSFGWIQIFLYPGLRFFKVSALREGQCVRRQYSYRSVCRLAPRVSDTMYKTCQFTVAGLPLTMFRGSNPSFT